MNRGIRRVGTGVVVLFVALAGQLSYLQLVRNDDLANDPRNVRIFLRDLTRARGPILTADGEIAAESVPSDDQFELQRRYPLGSLFAHVVGFQSILFGNTGVEASYNDELIGRDLMLNINEIEKLLGNIQPEGTVVLSLSRRIQEAARDALAGRAGSVVVLDVRTGAVAAMYSEPAYDPNLLAAHDSLAVRAWQQALLADPANPELARAWRERYPAGSTFKVITTALALDLGIATPDRDFPRLRELDLPQTNRNLQNFGGRECGGTLAESFRVSCNTTFAALGLELGEQLAAGIEDFGINTDPPPGDVNPPVVASAGPERGSFELDQPSFAQAAIGQGDVAMTPLEMAMVAAAVANGGTMMVPHVVSEVRDPDGVTVRRVEPDEWKRAMSPEAAATLTQFMVDVVENGTGGAARIAGIPVAGKTGTAQIPGGAPHAWFIGFAPADNPAYAVAVLVERGGDMGDEATGGRVAAPVAAEVLETALQG